MMITRRSLLALAAAAGASRRARAEAALFDDAKAYERFMGRWSRLLADELVDFTGVPMRARVLDVGSGTGALAFALAAKRPQAHVVGIDPAREYVDYAASRNPSPKLLSFEVGDAQKLRFPKSSFDTCASLLVFNFIPDPAKALQELIRVTRPGGRISAAVWDYGEGMKMLRLFWDAAIAISPDAASKDERHMPLCRKGQLGELWQKAGLEDLHDDALEITMKFDGFADFWEPFLLGQGPAGSFASKLAPDQLAKLRRNLQTRLPVVGEKTPFSLTARAWAVRGRVPDKRKGRD